MPINFPTSLDTLTNPSSGDYLDSGVVPHHLQHSDANDALEAIEAKLGIDGSAVTTSIDYKLRNTGSIDPGHRHSNLWNPDNTFNALTIDANSRISIPSSGTLGGILFGTDTNLYRSAADVLATDDTLKLAAGTTTLAPLQFQNGTNLSTPVSGSLEVQGGQLYYTDGSGRGKVKIRATVPMLLMAGYTPTASGGDIIYKVPRVNGASVTFNVKRLFWRVETAAAGEARLRVEKYTGTGVFSATNMHTGGDLSMSGGSTYEASTTIFTTTTLTSDDKVRVNATLLNAQAIWLVELELEEQ